MDQPLLSQDTLPSPLAIGSLTKYYYSYCTTSNVYTTPVSTSVNTVITIAFSNTVRAERSEDRHRMTPICVLRQLCRARHFSVSLRRHEAGASVGVVVCGDPVGAVDGALDAAVGAVVAGDVDGAAVGTLDDPDDDGTSVGA